MTSSPSPRAASAFHTVSWAALAIPVFVGGVVLFGWTFGVPDLARVVAGGVPMKPLPALAFVLAGVAVGLCQLGRGVRWRGPFARTCAGAVLLLGLLSLAEFGLGWDLGSGVPLFHKGGVALGAAAAQPASLWTALSFVLLGLALLWRSGGSRRSQSVSQALMFAVVFISLLTLVHDGFYTASSNASFLACSLSVTSAGMFLIVAAGLISGQPDHGVLALALSAGDGGRLARRLVPAALGGPVVCAVLLEFLLRHGWLHPGDGTAIFATLTVLVSLALILLNARSLNRWGQERQRAQAHLQRLNRSLRLLSESNQLLVRVEREEVFLQQTCQMAVDVGGYRLAWVGFAENDEARTVRPVAQAGVEQGYLEQARISWADTPQGRGPIGTAIRTGQPCVCQNILNDPRFEPWRSAAAARGYAAAAALPLRDDGRIFGALNLYASDAEAFDPDELRMLVELASDLSFGIATLRTRERQRRAEEAIERERILLRTVVDHLPHSVYVKDREGRKTLANRVELALMGLATEAEALGKTDFDVYPRELAARYAADDEQVLHNGQTVRDREESVVDAQGRQHWLLTSKLPLKDAQGRVVGLVGIGHDITERKRAEDALRESRARLQAVLDHSPAVIFIKDLDGRYLQVNRQFERLFHLPAPQVIGKTIHDLVSAEEAARLQANDLRVIEAGQAMEFEEVVSADGVPRPHISSKFPLRDSQGRIFALCGISFDITERKRAEEALRQSEQQFSKVFHSSPIGITIARLADGCFLDVNEAFLRDAGFPREEVVGHTALELGLWASPAERGEVLGQLQEQGRLQNREGKLRKKSGEPRAMLFSMELTELAGEKCILSLFLDITERKRAEESLAAEQHLLQTLMNTLPDTIYFKNAESRFTRINQAQAHRFGLTDPAQAVGRTDFDFFSEPHARRAYEDEQKIISSGQPLVNREERETWPNRPDTWVSTTKLPLRDKEGKIVGTFGVSRDITERRRAEEQIQQLNAELEQRVRDRTAQLEAANQEMESFSYSVSHDLRAPLRAINGYASILTEEYRARLDAEGQRLLGVVRAEAERMGQLIDDLLAFSRLGRQAMKRAPVDMTALAASVFRELAALEPQRAVQWDLKPLPPASGDPTLLRQVWVNLLSNALKYTGGRQPAVIEAGSRTENGQVIYYVKDNGAGFDMRYAAKLFGVFQRLHRADEFEGTGVGLALVQRIVLRHGGRVWGEGEVGKGATFYFALPAQA